MPVAILMEKRSFDLEVPFRTDPDVYRNHADKSKWAVACLQVR